MAMLVPYMAMLILYILMLILYMAIYGTSILPYTILSILPFTLSAVHQPSAYLSNQLSLVLIPVFTNDTNIIIIKGDVRFGQVGLSQVRACQVSSSHVRSGQSRSDQVRSSQVW